MSRENEKIETKSKQLIIRKKEQNIIKKKPKKSTEQLEKEREKPTIHKTLSREKQKEMLRRQSLQGLKIKGTESVRNAKVTTSHHRHW